jgi:hypothetical protein
MLRNAMKRFVVMKRDGEVPEDSPIARLVAERGATMPRRDLLALAAASARRPATGPESSEVLKEMREERL